MSNMKVCTRCGKRKKVAEFWRDRSTPDGLASWCHVCVNEKRRPWRERNRERDRAHVRAYKARHREQLREYDRRYNDENRADCPRCGYVYGKGSGTKSGGHDPRLNFSACPGCTERRCQQIVKWWAEGRSMKEIEAELDWTHDRLSVELHRLRERGYDLPYRRRMSKPRFPEQVAS